MKKISLLLVFLIIISVSFISSKQVEQVLSKTRINTASPLLKPSGYGNTPLYFIKNRGQVNQKASFYARTGGFILWITSEGLIFDSKFNQQESPEKSEQVKRDVSSLIFKGSNKHPQIIAIDQASHEVNHLTGNNPDKWVSGIPTSLSVLYKDLYPGIDLKVYGKGTTVEYDWIVHPGADPAKISFEYLNMQKTEPDQDGNIILKTGFGSLVHKKPISYQKNSKGKIAVVSSYRRITGNRFGFDIGQYDQTKPLIIDPVVLVYSTYLGGNAFDVIAGITVNRSREVYVVGTTTSTDFPTQNPYQGNYGGSHSDTIVSKFSSSGQSLVFSTYLGGNGYDDGIAIAMDNQNCVYIAGHTSSADFPILNAYQNTLDGESSAAFLTKISANGKSLIYSTYFPSIYPVSIAVDRHSCLYITGQLSSGGNLPLQNPYQGTFGGGYSDAFLTKLSSDGSSLVYSTYLGGSDANTEERGNDIAVDSNGCAYIVGETETSDFPTKNPFQGAHGGYSDVFVTKFAADGQSLVFSTYLGGSSFDQGFGIAVDEKGQAHVTGRVFSGFPLQVPYQGTFGGGGEPDAFITKFSADGQYLLYSTYLGGSGSEAGNDIALDSFGNVYITGETRSNNFPTRQAYQKSRAGDNDGFISKFSADGQSLIYSTYLGGSQEENFEAISVDSMGRAFVSGYTQSADFPTRKPFQANLKGGYDGFISCFSFHSDLTVTMTTDKTIGNVGDTFTYTVTVTNKGPNPSNGVNLNVTLPDGIDRKFVWTSIGNFQKLNGSWKIGDMAAGELQRMRIQARIERAGNFVARSYVSSPEETDFKTENNFDTAIISTGCQVSARVSGGNGAIGPADQTVGFGSTAVINIIPNTGYEIASLTDNGQSIPAVNLFLIPNVEEDHEVIATFRARVAMFLGGQRQSVSAWLITRDYALLSLFASDTSGMVSSYVIQRADGNGEFKDLKMVPATQLSFGFYIYNDTFIESGTTYLYRFRAMDSEGNILAVSNEITL